MIKAVVFDFDGLIMDTELPEYTVSKEMFRERGAELSLDVWGECVGTHADHFDLIGHLEDQIEQTVDREAFHEERSKRILSMLENGKPLPGVERYLEAAKELGLKIGLASSSHYEWVGGHLRRLGLLDEFGCIRTADNVERVKPDPALYLQAAECLGVRPEEAVAFEDSANGALAAKRAGMYCVVVPNEVTASLTFGDVDHRMESMAEMELAALIAFLTNDKKGEHLL
ncbi:MAG TPA: HAD family hydrolase [Bacillales bacterium]|nr:HAD family hydrolase [Bacillales bacterium]